MDHQRILDISGGSGSGDHLDPITRRILEKEIDAIRTAPRDLGILDQMIARLEKKDDQNRRDTDNELLRTKIEGLERVRGILRQVKGEIMSYGTPEPYKPVWFEK